MAWTYSGDPATSDRDAVRFLVGDTDGTDPQLSDSEIDFALLDGASVVGAALACADALLARYARLVDKSVGDLKISYSQRRDGYRTLSDRLRRRQASRIAALVTGISRSRKDVVDADADRVTPFARRSEFDHPGAG